MAYDIVPGEVRQVRRPDILIVEGLNVLQGGATGAFVSDYFDFSIYVDADPADIEEWYVARFLTLRDTAFRDPASYFHRYVSLSDDEAIAESRRIWREINLVNLRGEHPPNPRSSNLDPSQERRSWSRRRQFAAPVRSARWSPCRRRFD